MSAAKIAPVSTQAMRPKTASNRNSCRVKPWSEAMTSS